MLITADSCQLKLTMAKWSILRWCFLLIFVQREIFALPVSGLYDHSDAIQIPRGDDSSSREIELKVPIIFYGTAYDSIYVNTNGILSFQTELPKFFNIEFPLDYPVISPFYSNVDTTITGTVSYLETDSPALIQKATEEVHEAFLNHGDYQATSLFIATWKGVGYHRAKADKVNTYQVAIITDGATTFVQLLYPEDGLQWIQSTGDESGLPDARAQAGFISETGNIHALPASGTEQVKYLNQWSNVDSPGKWIYRVDQQQIQEPDQLNSGRPSKEPGQTCAEAQTFCHIQAKCIDYDHGMCCQCTEHYYGNGKSCIKRDAPLRVNGKVSGKVNDEIFDNLDLQSYIVMADARAYTAVSKIPESIGLSIQSLQIIGSSIAYLFAKTVRDAPNGFQLTGGVFNHTAIITFLNSSHTVVVKQRFYGLDVFDQLKLEANIQGEIPILPPHARVTFDEYKEDYTITAPGVIQMSGVRRFKYDAENEIVFKVEQTILFESCKFENGSVGQTWQLNVGKNFISYEDREQIVRFGLSNKISPLGDFDPCEEGRQNCGDNSVCVVENDSYKCVCSVGYTYAQTTTGQMCVDLNECQTGLHDCDFNAECINQIGSYVCQCNPGFEGDGHRCDNAASCSNVQCTRNAECLEDNGVAFCRCLSGYSGDGQNCIPITTKSCRETQNCSPFGYCAVDQSIGAYKCYCLNGYEGNGYTCNKIPVDETTEAGTTDKVPVNCLDDVCYCPEGFTLNEEKRYCVAGNGRTTSPTQKPLSGSCNDLNNCHKDGECIFNIDTYTCVCNSGFDGDGYTCTKERESCTIENNCDIHATCSYDEIIGKSRCICDNGYEGDGYKCTLAICTSDSECASTEQCLFTTERYECVCKEGYLRDSQNQCVDNSCGGGKCVDNAECLYDENDQTNYCSCKSGFEGDGITECKLRRYGCDIMNNCGLHASCLFDEMQQHYSCRCQEGFNGDGIVCFPEKNCNLDPGLCHRDASCIADANRKYRCECNPGYNGNGTICQPNPTHEGGFLLLNQGMSTLRIAMEEGSRNSGPIQIKVSQTAVGLDIDCVNGRVYWSDISGRAITSANYNGTEKKDFLTKDIGSPEGLAIDWVSRNVYWTDSTRDTIEVASLDGKRRRVLFNTDLVNPRGIAVHPQRGKIFWTDWDRKHPKIEWANADGSGRAIFLDGPSVSLPNSLTIDYDHEQLCFADAGTKKIECVQIDTRIPHTIAVNCTYPFGVAVTEKNIYWSDWISKKVERVDKYSLIRLAPLNLPQGGTGSRLYSLVAVPQRCPNVANVCQYNRGQCSHEHICLPNGQGSRTCVCTFDANAPDEKPTCRL